MSRGPFGDGWRATVGTDARGLRYRWVVLLVVGLLPALLFTNVLSSSVSAASASCTRLEFGAPGSFHDGCSIIAGELVVTVAVAWLVPVAVLGALLHLRRLESTEAAGAARGRTGVFVRATAVLLGLANALSIGDPADVVGAPPDRPAAVFLAFLILAVLSGLAASEIALRRGRSALVGGFFARYAITVLGLCLGGAILGGSS